MRRRLLTGRGEAIASAVWNGVFRGQLTGRSEAVALLAFNGVVVVASAAVWVFAEADIAGLWIPPAAVVLGALARFYDRKASKK